LDGSVAIVKEDHALGGNCWKRSNSFAPLQRSHLRAIVERHNLRIETGRWLWIGL